MLLTPIRALCDASLLKGIEADARSNAEPTTISLSILNFMYLLTGEELAKPKTKSEVA